MTIRAGFFADLADLPLGRPAGIVPPRPLSLSEFPVISEGVPGAPTIPHGFVPADALGIRRLILAGPTSPQAGEGFLSGSGRILGIGALILGAVVVGVAILRK